MNKLPYRIAALIGNLRNALKDADKDSSYANCIGCGHARDEKHKADCLVEPATKIELECEIDFDDT